MSAGTQASPEAVAQQLLRLWTLITRGSGRHMAALLEELDLSLTQMKALHMLDACAEELSVKELSERLAVSLPGASRIADGLLRRGLLERREDEHDRRVKRVRISPGGRTVVTRINTARLEGLEAFAASLTDAQRKRLSGALDALTLED